MNRQASVQDISWFIDLDSVERLDLNPPYQRRSVWTPSDRRFFLDTIFRNYPCPPIFIHKTIDDTGVATYHVVDGKQRLETILKFSKNRISISKDFGDEGLNGKKFKDLSPGFKKTFWNYSVPVDFIDLPSGLIINEIFDRVNRNSRNLERQELRHARYDGWFITECETEADEDEFWEKIKVTSKAKAKRMKNVQLVSELLLIVIDNKIVGFDQDYLDEKYAELDSLEDNEDFDEDSYRNKKNRAKEFISRMEDCNNSITIHAKTANNIYTLFALIVLEDFNDTPEELATKYDAFMNLVDTFKQTTEQGDVQDIDIETMPTNWDFANKYYANTLGASTEPPQRIARYEALKSALL
jgi:hypothetical protein